MTSWHLQFSLRFSDQPNPALLFSSVSKFYFILFPFRYVDFTVGIQINVGVSVFSSCLLENTSILTITSNCTPFLVWFWLLIYSKKFCQTEFEITLKASLITSSFWKYLACSFLCFCWCWFLRTFLLLLFLSSLTFTSSITLWWMWYRHRGKVPGHPELKIKPTVPFSCPSWPLRSMEFYLWML